MLEACMDAAEKLYLQKDASGEISVPCSDLTQHQIDGVRFLFTQYKKEKLGVIMNYSPGCGNSVQVAVFISAICEKLKRPVLILYDTDSEKEAWLARFARWTTIREDSIEVDAPNAYLRKQIFIKNIVDVGKFYRRSWGIVVVKSDSFMNMFCKCQLKVDFKIWITAQDLKIDRKLLHSVYTWINPSDQLLPQYLDKKSTALFKEDSTNEMLLDLLLEDILFTRRGLKPFGTHKRKLDSKIQPIRIVSKKNKDATGTKIKRSKKYLEDPPTPTTPIESITSLSNNDNSFDTTNVSSGNSNGDTVATNSFTINADRIDKEEESKMDVESFIRDNDPLQSDINLSIAVGNLDNTSQPSDTNSPKAEEVSTDSTLNFANAVADIIRIENDISTEILEDSSTLNLAVAKDNVIDSTQDVAVAKDVEAKDSTGLSQIDLSKPLYHKVFFVSSQKDSALEPDLDDQVADEAKTEQGSTKTEKNGVADQESKLEVSNSVMKETESSFDAKMKETEERALRKFKGSLLDNIF